MARQIRHIAVAVLTILAVLSPTTAHAKKQDRCSGFDKAFAYYGLPIKPFSFIAYRESRCNVDAVNARWDANGNIVWTLNRNGTYDSGLLQINSSWKSVTRKVCGGGIELLRTLDCNLKVAKYLYDNGGLGHWGM